MADTLSNTLKVNDPSWDDYKTQINYDNEMIKLYQLDKLSKQTVQEEILIDNKIKSLVDDRNTVLEALNKRYDMKTNELNLSYKLDTNDQYVKKVQTKTIHDNDNKIREFNKMKMNKNRLYEIKSYEVDEKKNRVQLLFWTMITLFSLLIIFIINHQFNSLFNNPPINPLRL